MNEENERARRQEQLLASLKKLSPVKQTLLKKRLQGASHVLPVIERVPRDRELPLSFFQERELVRLFPTSQSTASPLGPCVRLQGPLDYTVLQECLDALAARHEVLRTTYHQRDGRHFQVIASTMKVNLPIINLEHLSEPERIEEALRLVSQESYRPYDFTREPMWRTLLLRLGAEDHVLLLTIDHFISDAWSVDLMMRDAWMFYALIASGSKSPVAELPFQYADFAYWQRQTVQGRELDRLLSFWMRKLEGMGLKPEIHLPNENPLPTEQGDQEFASLTLDIPAAVTRSLEKLSQEKNVTMFILSLAALVALLRRYTGRDDIGVRAPVANRYLPGTEDIIGWFTNILIFRFDLSGVTTFADLLQRVQASVLETYDYQALPYVVLRKHYLRTGHDIHHPCIRFNMFAEVGQPSGASASQPASLWPASLMIKPFPVPRPAEQQVRHPGISINMSSTRKGLSVVVLYEVRRYPESLIAELMENFRIVLEGIIAHPEQRLTDFPIAITSG